LGGAIQFQPARCCASSSAAVLADGLAEHEIAAVHARHVGKAIRAGGEQRESPLAPIHQHDELKMATRGIAHTIEFVVWDATNNTGKTGDNANLTLRWGKDGTNAAPTNASSEVDSTNKPGLYKLTLTTTETDCNVGVLGGKSSSSGVVVIPTKIEFVFLPDALPDAATGLVTTTAFQARTLAAASYATASAVAAIAAIFTGITSLAQWLGLIAGKQTGNSTARTELRATGAGSGTYDETTDSLEANRDNIGTAGASLTAADDAVITAIAALPTAAANAAAVEASILNEGDATALLAAIAAKVETFLINEGDATATMAAIATAVRTNLATELARIDAAISTRATPAQVATELATYDGPTHAEMTAELATADDATLAAIALISKLLRADRKIDKTTDPAHWDEVLLEEGTSTELVRRELFDADGTALAAETTRIGRAIKSP
jgi:hypothetical protein